MTEHGELVVRRATPEDLEAILVAFARLRRAGSQLPSDEQDQLVACDHCRCAVVATMDGAVVGYGRWVRATASSPRADMAVAVAEAWEQRGIGTAVLTQLRIEARRRGVTCLEVRMARTPDVVRDIARHPAQGRFDDSAIVLSLRVNELLPGQERDAMRWAALGHGLLIGPVVGQRARRPGPTVPA